MFGMPSPTWLAWFSGPVVVVLTLTIVAILYSKEKKQVQENKGKK